MLTNFKVLMYIQSYAAMWHETFNIVYRKMLYTFVDAIDEFQRIAFLLYADCVFYCRVLHFRYRLFICILYIDGLHLYTPSVYKK